MKSPTTQVLPLFLVFCALFSQDSAAQMTQTFPSVFDYFFIENFNLEDFHGAHYIPASQQANEELTPALNNMIAANISSFPLSSTVAGFTFNIVDGVPVFTNQSLGPIYAETAETIGPGKININLTYSYLNLNRFRGIPVADMQFKFTHEDLTSGPGRPQPEPAGSESLGNPGFELDNIDVFPNLNIESNIVAFTLTAGVLKNLDISLAVPIVNIHLSGNAEATINSFTYGRLDPDFPERQGAAHSFGQNPDPLNPVLHLEKSYDVSTNGIGDIAIRLKYVLLRESALNLAGLADIRLPTGDEKNFLGTGEMNYRFLWVLSNSYGNFNPHLNIGYDRRGADFDSDEIEYIVGFDQKLSNSLTFAVDILGSYDLDETETIQIFPGTVNAVEEFLGGSVTRTFDLSNIPEFDRDNTLDLSVGFRVAPSDKLLLMGNALIPLNDGGLRSSITPTIGLSIVI